MRKSVRRATLVLALTPLLSVPVSAVAFAGTSGGGVTTITNPAPAGDASAVAAEVSGIIAVGKTHAHAGSGGGAANADSLDLLGTRVVGGDQDKVGSSSGELIGTGSTPLGDAEVAPWSASVSDKDGGYQAMAEAALAHVNLADVVEAWVLHSTSRAAWTEDKSSGDAESDGAEVNVLDMLDVKVLHSEAHSTGKGSSALLVVNGTGIGTSDDANGMCAIDADPLLELLCLNASGGVGNDGVAHSGGDVATVDVGGGSLTGTISGSTSSGGSAADSTPDAPKPTHPGHHPQPQQGPLPHTDGPQGLPFTGAELGRMGAVGAAVAALGAAMLAFARRRRETFAF